MKPATPEERAKYRARAYAYDEAATALENTDDRCDRHARGTLDTMAQDLRDMARRWRNETGGGL